MATSGAGAAIGSGSKSNVDEIIINGGEIITTSNNTNDYNSKGAAIGTRTYGSVKKITINNSDDLTLLNIPDLAAINYVKIDDVDFNIESSKSKNDLYLYLIQIYHSVTINNTIKDIEYFAKYIQENNTFILTKETEDETPPEEINTAPVIAATDISLKQSSEFNDEIDKINVKADDEENGDLTDRIQVIENNVNTSVIGKYTVKFMVEDNNNGISYYLINVDVVDTIKDEKTKIITNDITISINDKFNDDFILKNVQAF